MPNTTSERLKHNIPRIMDIWVHRADEEVKAAHFQHTLALKNSLPEYLGQLVDALSKTIDRTAARKRHDKAESTRVGKIHGKERASTDSYTMDQMILEYHILRQVVCDVMEEDQILLTPVEREVIVCSVEQAVNDAATEFSNTLKSIQEKLSHTLAHDLRNPIAAAKVSANLILRRPDNLDGTIKSAGRIVGCMDRLDNMISDLLDASRIRAGETLKLETKECDLDWIVREVASEATLIHNVPFKIISNSPCKGVWNEDGLRRVLENLTNNAVKYGAKNGLITVSVTQDPEFATLSVHNVGNPIAKEDLPILFQQFRRAKSVEKKVGWGLGLTMVEGMIESHKGSIKVESEKETGTTFTIKLPKRVNASDEVFIRKDSEHAKDLH